MDDTIIMDSVIQKYFAGETSEQEEKYLLAWLEESEEHRKYFFELKSLWGARRVFEESTDLSRFASFMRSTDHRIGSIVAGERSTRRRRLVRWTLLPSCSPFAPARHGISSRHPTYTGFTRTRAMR